MFVSLLVVSGMITKSQTAKAQPNGNDLLRKMSEKLNQLKTVRYQYSAEMLYADENYHNTYVTGSFIAFRSGSNIQKFRFQFSNSDYLACYNGNSFFTLDHRAKTIQLTQNPDSNYLEQMSAMNNSFITLRAFAPLLTQEEEIPKLVTDTIIHKKAYYAIKFTLFNKYIGPLGDLKPFSATYTGSKYKPYILVLDKSSFLPFQFISKFGDREKDFIAVSFLQINTNPALPKDSSWEEAFYAKTYTAPKPEKALIAAGTMAANWVLPYYLDGKIDTASLDEYRGKIVVMDFWIKGCGPCIASFPHLNELQENYGPGNLQLISINTADNLNDIKFFQDKHKIAYRMHFDGNKLAAEYGVAAYPTIIILDKAGKIIYSAAGFDQAVIEQIITENL
jgi:thiol-disulfide isomerase/thioredoxin/outer membrane lipoprotein-sorting protein